MQNSYYNSKRQIIRMHIFTCKIYFLYLKIYDEFNITIKL